ncbi:MAG: hypothetical protein E6Q25_06400 [Acinetobacter sp.]|jgi:hypothetical protein|nr:MAG: hypothetical protein E6Q25_06400 [Acinetobacter sp.]
MQCPNCHSEVLTENINIQADIAKCIACNHVFKVSEQLNRGQHAVRSNFNPNQPPKGICYQQNRDEVVMTISTRHPVAFLLVPFMLLWSGMSLGGIYGTQIIQQKFNLIQSLFGIPFVLASMFFWVIVLMTVIGKIEIHLNRQGGTVFTGIGRLGRKQTFVWREVSNIYEHHFNDKRGTRIRIDGQHPIVLSIGSNPEKHRFITQALQRMQAQSR